ncbi:uncharacterized protein BJ171DRAFT_577333 [Polychytrium aggregatum]|uniref:uncharacterized protein n=1 Tax=Polychytrium aggregatum TaxID=110093 RepID=UPI0022FE99E6|nr:uncharacterized protein BJ171DRAFT_577333 [Polychytrium aggregatum]KAI9208983.1 hypothetical protein BJ171DRAFT_577333 [Polychytrium aggregatum]
MSSIVSNTRALKGMGSHGFGEYAKGPTLCLDSGPASVWSQEQSLSSASQQIVSAPAPYLLVSVSDVEYLDGYDSDSSLSSIGSSSSSSSHGSQAFGFASAEAAAPLFASRRPSKNVLASDLVPLATAKSSLPTSHAMDDPDLTVTLLGPPHTGTPRRHISAPWAQSEISPNHAAVTDGASEMVHELNYAPNPAAPRVKIYLSDMPQDTKRGSGREDGGQIGTSASDNLSIAQHALTTNKENSTKPPPSRALLSPASPENASDPAAPDAGVQVEKPKRKTGPAVTPLPEPFRDNKTPDPELNEDLDLIRRRISSMDDVSEGLYRPRRNWNPPAAGGFRAGSPVRATHKIQSAERPVIQNEDHCSACFGSGRLLCCDTCPRVFHHSCTEEGYGSDEDVEGFWQCKRTSEPSTSIRAGKRGRSSLSSPEPAFGRESLISSAPAETPSEIFSLLIQNLESMNPRSFELPIDIRSEFKNVMTHPTTRCYIDTRSVYIKLTETRGNRNWVTVYEPDGAITQSQQTITKPRARNYFGRKNRWHTDDGEEDSRVPVEKCYKCGQTCVSPSQLNFLNSSLIPQPHPQGTADEHNTKSIRIQQQRSEMIKCDYCDLWWHLDCLDIPLAMKPTDPGESIDVDYARYFREKMWGKDPVEDTNQRSKVLKVEQRLTRASAAVLDKSQPLRENTSAEVSDDDEGPHYRTDLDLVEPATGTLFIRKFVNDGHIEIVHEEAAPVSRPSRPPAQIPNSTGPPSSPHKAENAGERAKIVNLDGVACRISERRIKDDFIHRVLKQNQAASRALGKARSTKRGDSALLSIPEKFTDPATGKRYRLKAGVRPPGPLESPLDMLWIKRLRALYEGVLDRHERHPMHHHLDLLATAAGLVQRGESFDRYLVEQATSSSGSADSSLRSPIHLAEFLASLHSLTHEIETELYQQTVVEMYKASRGVIQREGEEPDWSRLRPPPPPPHIQRSLIGAVNGPSHVSREDSQAHQAGLPPSSSFKDEPMLLDDAEQRQDQDHDQPEANDCEDGHLVVADQSRQVPGDTVGPRESSVASLWVAHEYPTDKASSSGLDLLSDSHFIKQNEQNGKYVFEFSGSELQRLRQLLELQENAQPKQ